jgi:hypothetical protein
METQEIVLKELAVINKAGDILTANELRVSKGEANGNILASRWQEANSIADPQAKLQALAQVDADTNNYLAACTTVIKELKTNREPITQMMTEFARKFSGAENKLDKANTASIAYKLQQQRNEYATLVATMKRKAEEEAQKAAALQLAKDIYYIDLKSGITALLNEQIASKKANINNYVNGVTLDTIATAKERLCAWNENIDAGLFKNRLLEIPSALHVEDKQAIINNLLGLDITGSMQYVECCKAYNTEIKAYIQTRLDDFVGIEAELQSQVQRQEAQRIANEQAAQAKDEEAKAKALEAQKAAELAQEKALEEKAQREATEVQRLQEAQAQAAKDAELQAQVDKEGAAAMASFNAMTATPVIDAPEARSGYEIQITHISGYAQIMAIWFELEAPNVALDKVANTKIDAIVKWAAKLAFNKGTKVSSQFVKYNEVFKAVNRSSNDYRS